jgi:hypothetical protein
MLKFFKTGQGKNILQRSGAIDQILINDIKIK